MPAASPEATSKDGSLFAWTMKCLRDAAVAGGVAIAVGAHSLVVGAAFVYAVAAGLGLDAESQATPSE